MYNSICACRIICKQCFFFSYWCYEKDWFNTSPNFWL